MGWQGLSLSVALCACTCSEDQWAKMLLARARIRGVVPELPFNINFQQGQ